MTSSNTLARTVLISVVVLLVVAAGLFLWLRDQDTDSSIGAIGSPSDQTWLLPADLFEESDAFDFASELGPALGPLTVSLWRNESDWVVVQSRPWDPDAQFTPQEDMSLVVSVGRSTGFGTEDLEVTMWLSNSLCPETEGSDLEDDQCFLTEQALAAALENDPHPERIDLPSFLEFGPLDPALEERIRGFRLASEVVIEGDSDPRAILAASEQEGAIMTLADPIPLGVIPDEVVDVTEGKDYEVHETGAKTFIVRGGAVHAVISGPDAESRRLMALKLVEVDDLRWGDWAWPRMADWLRLADLDSDATAGNMSCSLVIISDDGCREDVTPSSGLVWMGADPTLAENDDGTWTVSLPVDAVELAEGVDEQGMRVGVVRSNVVLVEFVVSDLPTTIEATTSTQREAMRLIKMLYPSEPLGS